MHRLQSLRLQSLRLQSLRHRLLRDRWHRPQAHRDRWHRPQAHRDRWHRPQAHRDPGGTATLEWEPVLWSMRQPSDSGREILSDLQCPYLELSFGLKPGTVVRN